ncbi:hypothetical protein MMC19_007391 [Ptychographa xylographoides]|nr:hypothetical protein [Ptychographa xylographoides]
MFRKPREQLAVVVESPPTPSVGRPPTPPGVKPKPIMASATKNISSLTSQPIPVLGRSQTILRGVGSNRGSPSSKSKGKPNGSILNFFKKTDSPLKSNPSTTDDESSLFFEDHSGPHEQIPPTQTPTPPRDGEDFSSSQSLTRYNEDPLPFKRRRISITSSLIPEVTADPEKDDHMSSLGAGRIDPPAPSLIPVDNSTSQPTDGFCINLGGNCAVEDIPAFESERDASSAMVRSSGPFIEDSDSEDERLQHFTSTAFNDAPRPHSNTRDAAESSEEIRSEFPDSGAGNIPPTFKREATSAVDGDGFDGIEDFIDDEFPVDGEEYMERLWMDEQERLELGLEDNDVDDDSNAANEQGGIESTTVSVMPSHDSAGTCPICAASFAGITSEQAEIHVNHCLDGKPVPLPPPTVGDKGERIKQETTPSSYKRFQRSAIAKPGQSNPFAFGPSSLDGTSAFSKLMSNHAEDAAWATAAAAEMASRGKPAFQRTCPFYKILPGFNICVDAFRYGAIEGCKAYFLSHFHSDHYIGLTSSWCHGPIYCSHVTANLVRRQLRVDPKWVVDLEFDQKVQIPGSEGVDVTMIPANHCPGSSLYLFEKIISRGKTPKLQRILHCGDFRACPAHVQHPLLRPEVADAITGKNVRQQKLDVCYLDTTYLTPKYAFPSQEEVIKACADMCVSLSKERVDETDDWEQSKKERAGTGMVKFVKKTSDLIKEESGESDDTGATKVDAKAGTKARGRLLVIVGTYSIGKERICLGVARALNSKIYAPPNKQKICAALEDRELMARLTDDPLEAQVHMQMLMEIRAETLADYLTSFKPHFSRIVGFRPSGWNYRPPNSRFVESPAVQTVLHSENWKSKYSMAELVPQRGSTHDASCFGVPYSEHSSFRELTMFCCALRIDKIIPTVNVGSAKSREKMKAWCEKWAVEKKKNGLYKVTDGQTSW